MENKTKSLFRKICKILFRKKARRTIWGRKFDGENPECLQSRESNKVSHFTLRDDSIACRQSKSH